MMAQFTVWGSYYRPLGGLFYMPLYELAGLNPLPYRAVILAFLTLNTYLTYATARLLTRSVIVAFGAAVLTCFHGAQFALYYNTSQVYDVLCFTFWYAAFYYYARIRLQERYLGAIAIVTLLVLYVCALNAKEMGVTLPLLLLIFEVAFARHTGLWREQFRIRQPIQVALPFVILGIATLAYVYGKTVGSKSMAAMDAYRPRLSLGMFLDSNAHYAAELFYQDGPTIGRWGIVFLWLVMLYLAMRRRQPHLYWALANVTLGTIPIALIPERPTASMYLPAFGYALFTATVLHMVIRWISREPLFRRLRIGPLPTRAVLSAVAVAAYGANMHDAVDQGAGAWRASQDQTFSAMQQLNGARSRIKRGARMVYLEDPLLDWEAYFVTRLVLNDHAADITLQKKHDHILTAAELDQYDHVLTFENGTLRLIR